MRKIITAVASVVLITAFACTKVKESETPVNFPDNSLKDNTIELLNSGTTVTIDSVNNNNLMYELYSDSLNIILYFMEQPTRDFIYLLNDSREKYACQISVFDQNSVYYRYTGSSNLPPAKIYIKIEGNKIKGMINNLECHHNVFVNNVYSHSIKKKFSLKFSTHFNN